MLDYGSEGCAAHVTGLEKWPGFQNLPKPRRQKKAANSTQPAAVKSDPGKEAAKSTEPAVAKPDAGGGTADSKQPVTEEG